MEPRAIELSEAVRKLLGLPPSLQANVVERLRRMTGREIGHLVQRARAMDGCVTLPPQQAVLS